MGVRVAITPHAEPPRAYRIDGKGGSVVVDADADPPLVVGDVVDAVGRGTTELGVDEVMDPNVFG